MQPSPKLCWKEWKPRNPDAPSFWNHQHTRHGSGPGQLARSNYTDHVLHASARGKKKKVIFFSPLLLLIFIFWKLTTWQETMASTRNMLYLLLSMTGRFCWETNTFGCDGEHDGRTDELHQTSLSSLFQIDPEPEHCVQKSNLIQPSACTSAATATESLLHCLWQNKAVC